MAHATKNKITTLILTLLMFVTLTFGQGNLPVFSLVAKAASNSFETSNVLSDLQGSEDFSIYNYPAKENGYLQVINFVEYCYSYRSNLQKDYEMYIYIYNPAQIDIDTSSYQNKVQMAVEYNNDGLPSKFEKFRLKFCSTVESGEYKHLFYKFKVVDRKIDDTYFHDRVNPSERRYDISGIEIKSKEGANATEYKVAATYKFTGFAEGYGENRRDKSTLVCSVTNMETLSLDVKHTNFRTGVSNLGPDHYNEVNSVYFSVPERVFEQYGYLQKIRAEWWEYKTKMMAVTSNESFYNEMLKYIGTDVGTYDSTVLVYLYSGYKGQYGTSIGTPSYHYYDWCYNKSLETQYTIFGTPFAVYEAKVTSSIMPYVFFSQTADVDSAYNLLHTATVAGDVNGTILKDWIYNYRNDLGRGYIDCNGRSISVDLFESYVDDGRVLGHNDRTIDLSDTFNLNSYDSNHTWWDKLWDFGFSWPSTSEEYNNVPPIYEVKAEDLLGKDEDIAKALLVNIDDVPMLRAYYTAEILKGNRVILFRFADTDYYCAKAYTSAGSTEGACDTYVAKQTVFLDFDIIELTFNKDGVYYVIPAVADPIDIVNDITAPEEEFEWWKIVVAILMLVLLIIAIYLAIPYAIRAVLWLVSLPIKALKTIIKVVTTTKRKKEEE